MSTGKSSGYSSRRIGAGRAQPVLCVQLERGVTPSPELAAELRALGAADPRTAAIARILYREDFPVDVRHNSKIDRPQLGRWAAAQP